MATSELVFLRTALGAFVQSKSAFQVVCSADVSDPAPIRLSISPVASGPSLQQLIVLDSSFNPPTMAHMHMALSAMQQLSAHTQITNYRLLLLLSVNNADKAPKPAAFEHRLVLMLAMARDLQRRHSEETGVPPQFSPTIDIGLTSRAFFHDKSRAIAMSDFYTTETNTVSNSPEQIFLIGFDTLIRVFDPKYYTLSNPPLTPLETALAPFLRRSRLRVTTRPDDQWGSEDMQKRWLTTNLVGLGCGENWLSRVDLTSGTYRGDEIVSSTMAREAAKQKDWVRLAALVSPLVLSWIQSEKLYGEECGTR